MGDGGTGTPETIVWADQLGGQLAELRQVGERRTLRIGDRQTVIGPDTTVRHRGSLRRRQLVVEQPDAVPFTYRYRVPWRLVFLSLYDPTFDRFDAEADDPGLVLTDLLGGTYDWS
ncbi:hypothetical protein ACFQO7_24080 [Catellatospora aurea]|uniref:Uncharacterized protein n=1 Tax=Catellatospora aurea TaxID=1337874 RepID=A0ABW2H046_9ACTN